MVAPTLAVGQPMEAGAEGRYRPEGPMAEPQRAEGAGVGCLYGDHVLVGAPEGAGAGAAAAGETDGSWATGRAAGPGAIAGFTLFAGRSNMPTSETACPVPPPLF